MTRPAWPGRPGSPDGASWTPCGCGSFERGALAGTDPARVPLTATHPRDAGTLPIGVTVELEEWADAAWGAWRVSDILLGNEVLALARDGVPLGLSVGFAEVPGGSRWSADRQRVTRTRAELDHIAVVKCRPTWAPGWSACVEEEAPRAPPRSLSPSCAAMGKHTYGFVRLGLQGVCIGCKNRFVGKGDRCQNCAERLRQRRRRKPR
jgi:hypothetical protein